jgi:hypothetical protein
MIQHRSRIPAQEKNLRCGPGRCQDAWRVRGAEGNAVTTDDLGQNDPSGLPVPQDGEQPQDTLLGQPPGGEPELDTYGVPVQDRPAKGRVYLGVTASSVCAVISGLLVIVPHTSPYYKLPAWQVWLGAAAGLLAALLAKMTLKRAEKDKQQLGVPGRSILWAISIVGFAGFVFMMGDLQGPLCATC